MWIYPFEGGEGEGEKEEKGENGENGEKGKEEGGMFMFDSGKEEFLTEYRQKEGRMVHKVCSTDGRLLCFFRLFTCSLIGFF